MSSARSAPRSHTTVSRYAWASEDPSRIGLHVQTARVGDDEACDHVNALMDAITTCRAGESFLLWTKYRALAAIHDQLAAGTGDEDARLVSQQSQVAARYGMTGAISPHLSARHVNEAIAMVHRLPLTGERLRDGILAPWQFTRIVSRSDLIDGEGYRADVDDEIARRVLRGSWPGKRLDALVDSAIFRHDPDAVRRRHEDAKDNRTVTVDPVTDGMAELRATASVEDITTAFAALTALVKRVCCPNDPRRRGAQRSDALIARLNGVPFECECGSPDSCTGTPETAGLSERQVVIAMHVITEQTTLDAETGSAADGMGYIDRFGVISGDQVRDIANRSDTKVSYFPNPPAKHAQPQPDSRADTGAELEAEPVLDFDDEPEPPIEPEPEPEPRETTEAPACLRKPTLALPLPCLRSDPYRFSTAFDTYIRARDLACTAPGCDKPAFAAQLDHCTEYNHDNPAHGGRTEAANMHALCVFHHLLKTGDSGWLDDMSTDPDGRVRYRIRTPEGLWIDGPDLTGTDLFTTLGRIRFADPPTPTSNSSATKPHPHCTPSTADKHRRRQHEREQNRAEREAAEQQRIAGLQNPSHTSPTCDIEPIDPDDNPPPF